MLGNLKGKVLLKKLNNLNWEEYCKENPTLNITEGDSLLVEDLTKFSEKTVSALKGKIKMILHKTPINPKLKEQLNLPLYLLEEELIETERFAIVDEAAIDSKRAKSNILDSIIQGYKKERMKQ